MAFIICPNQFHFPKTDPASLKLVSKMTLKKWNTNSCLKHPDLEKRKKSLSDVVFHFILSNRIFRKLFVHGKHPNSTQPNEIFLLLAAILTCRT